MLENVTIAWLFCDVLQSEFRNHFLRLHNEAQMPAALMMLHKLCPEFKLPKEAMSVDPSS